MRSRNLYSPDADKPFKLSRAKIELFLQCPRCFYLDRCKGIARPSGPPFNLNKAVDTLLKKEFDVHRAAGAAHPLMEAYGIKAVPFAHNELSAWRENFVGVQSLHEETGLLITGAVDDVWQNEAGELMVVDYKATAKDSGPVEELNNEWHNGYKRQMEVYQWLLRRKGFRVSDTGYFVYCTGTTDRAAFDAKLEFAIRVILYEGDDDWVEPTLLDMHACLKGKRAPQAEAECEFCTYVREAGEVEKE